ncbi:hypothetical protein [Sutcliffiella halmapala]|uniref:hypothetical protein n=1 Tax=Sutcliffiella halmapala TaxID=79882 RepID=UPI00147601ED|nr:hypothetical protein [Sutcliffiella halmapala]
MSELVDQVTYLHEDIEKVEVDVYVDDTKGVETTSITIYLEDGGFRNYSFDRQM